MFASKNKNKKPGSSSNEAAAAAGKGTAAAAGSEHELTIKEQTKLLASNISGSSIKTNNSKNNKSQQQKLHQQFDTTAGYDERQSFLNKTHKISAGAGGGSKAKLAKQETIEEQDKETINVDTSGPCGVCSSSCCCCSSCCSMMLKWKWILIPPIFIICCIAAIYCIPFIDIETNVPMMLPHIPFNFREGPMRPSTASQFKIERLFDDQIKGPESVALDTQGNMYMAIEGGFILYAHLNKSSIPKRTYYINDPPNSLRSQRSFDILSPDYMELVKIAELNGPKQPAVYAGLPSSLLSELTRSSSGSSNQQRRSLSEPRALAGGASGSGSGPSTTTKSNWGRECQLDEQFYGQNLYTEDNNNDGNQNGSGGGGGMKKFYSKVVISRCSKPLGVRLSPDENYLYVVDTLSALYRVDLKNPDRQFTTQRSVTKLIDFRTDRYQLLPIVSLEEENLLPVKLQQKLSYQEYANISLMAVDDLVIDYGAGSRGGDMIYLTVASQNWMALSFVYDLLEGRPSGAILRYDTGKNQLIVLSPSRVAHVRTSVLEFDQDNQLAIKSRVADDRYLKSTTTTTTSESNAAATPASSGEDIYLAAGLGAPRLDENDIFDDRPLHFPNGIELTDDRQAILIADTINKRIIKHYIKGVRRGTSDLWAWTPQFPDNIRRGYDRQLETYWVVGCGEDTTNKIDVLAWLNNCPRVKKYILKNIYLFGRLLEIIGDHLLGSQSIRDYGYSLKIGNTLMENSCSGMMIVQYNKYGDVIRSVHSKEFPNDISLYSQVDEVIDAKQQEHILYLSSPSYKYVTKLVLPSDSFDLSSSSSSSF